MIPHPPQPAAYPSLRPVSASHRPLSACHLSEQGLEGGVLTDPPDRPVVPTPRELSRRLTADEISVISRHYNRYRVGINQPGVIPALLTDLGQTLSEGRRAELLHRVGYDGQGLFSIEYLFGIMKILKEEFADSPGRSFTQSEIDTLEAFVSLGGYPDETGEIEQSALTDVVSKFCLNETDIERLIKNLDEDGSGKLNFQEFRSLFARERAEKLPRTLNRETNLQRIQNLPSAGPKDTSSGVPLPWRGTPIPPNHEATATTDSNGNPYSNVESTSENMSRKSSEAYYVSRVDTIQMPPCPSHVDSILHPRKTASRGQMVKPLPEDLHRPKFFTNQRTVTPRPTTSRIDELSRKLQKDHEDVRMNRLRLRADIERLRKESTKQHQKELELIKGLQHLATTQHDELWRAQVVESREKLCTVTKNMMRPKRITM